MTKLRIVVTFVVLASLPILLSFAIVFIGGLGSRNSDYGAAAPWLIVIAGMWTPGWAAIVAIGLALYVWKRGIRKSTLRHENLVVVAVILAVVAGPSVSYSIWNARQAASMDLADADERAGRELIEQSAAVAEKITPPFQVFTNYRGLERNGVRRLAYSVFHQPLEEGASVHVVVDVEKADAGRRPKIVCILSSEQFAERRDQHGNRADHARLCEERHD